MGQFDGVLLVSDFDHTLYCRPFGISPENTKAIQSFIRRGGAFTVATGRDYITFASFASSIPMNGPAVLSNGAVIYDFATQHLLHHTCLPNGVVRDCLAVIAQFPDIGCEFYYQNQIYAFQPNAITKARAAQVGFQYIVAAPEEIPLPWTKILFQQENWMLKDVQAYILSRWPNRYEVIFSNPHLLELTRYRSNKGVAVQRVAALLRIDPSNVYCVGDNQNDIPMLEVARIGFAPSNCSPEVRAWGPHMLGACNEHCIAQAIAVLEARY